MNFLRRVKLFFTALNSKMDGDLGVFCGIFLTYLITVPLVSAWISILSTRHPSTADVALFPTVGNTAFSIFLAIPVSIFFFGGFYSAARETKTFLRERFTSVGRAERALRKAELSNYELRKQEEAAVEEKIRREQIERAEARVLKDLEALAKLRGANVLNAVLLAHEALAVVQERTDGD